MTIPSSVTSIGNSAFASCTGLTSISIPSSVTTIEGGAFAYCSGLTSVTISPSVTSIGGRAFYGCTGLTSVAIPSSVTTIGNEAFRNCTGLTSVTIPSSVTSIGSQTFYGCTGLTSVTIPSSVTIIGEGAFSYCSGLTSITIPNSVESIERNAFSGCSNLTEITSQMVAPPIIGADVFPASFKTSGTLYIPAGTRSIYVERGWSLYFANIVEMEDGEQIWLSIVDAEQGCTELRCKAGETYTFRFKPADGWRVHSVMFRGADVTSWLTDDGEFTTPAMSANTDLVITYEQGTDAVKATADESDMRVVVINNDIVVRNAPAGTPITIYDLSGRLIHSATAQAESTRVAVGSVNDIVIVKIGDRCVKVAIK